MDSQASGKDAGSASVPNNGTPDSPKRMNGLYNARSYRLNVINWWNVYVQVYAPYLLLFIATCLCASALYQLRIQQVDVATLPSIALKAANAMFERHGLGFQIVGAVAVVIAYIFYRERPVYLVDFATFKPPVGWQFSKDDLLHCMENQGTYEKASIEFLSKVMYKSGTGDTTSWPPQFHDAIKNPGKTDIGMEMARQEAKTVIFGCIDELIRKTGLKMKDVDFLVLNCSLFCPTPSLCAMISSHYQMRPDVCSYNLGGMGCSAGVISVELAHQLLSANPRKTALVISTENLTQNLYYGKEKGMLLQNTLFRVGGAALLLSNRWADGLKAKYKMLYIMRTQNNRPDAYQAIYQCEDSVGNKGVSLSKEIVKVAGQTMKQNLTSLGPYILPLREQAKVVLSMAASGLSSQLRRGLEKVGQAELAERVPRVSRYLPDFTRAVDHICIHAGGRAVLDGIEANLGLPPEYVEPSRSVLYKYGNTSSSSIWYELEHIEGQGNMRAGHRVLQIAFGSGFKCNSAVWLRLRR